MSAPARGSISFEGVWKQFHRGEFHDSLRDLVPSFVRRVLGRGGKVADEGRVFWALQEVSFTVAPGEVLGIIGANGAGKSTALKILTGILEPTRGHYRVEGRVGALLEVAAGFHPDLTGRENVFLQGAIIGMTQREITDRFQEIVDFAGVADFMDTPVKRYSSGMSARLGFAIAAHLDPDVLIIDEVLAVGDFAFQQQAFDRIKRLVGSGVPVVLVSHQLERVTALCNRAILLDHGIVRTQGTPEECILEYVSGTSQLPPSGRQFGDLPIQLFAVEMRPPGPLPSGSRASFRLEGRIHSSIGPSLDPWGIRIVSAQTGQVIFATSARECGMEAPRDAGGYAVELDLQLNVPAGAYLVQPAVVDWTNGYTVAMGPLTFLHVSQGTPFRGVAQMDARMRRLASDADPQR